MATLKDSNFHRYQIIRWSVYISLFLGYSSYYFSRKSYTFAIPALIRDLNLKKNELGVITSGFAAMYGVGKFTGGLLSDSLSPRTMFTAGMLLTATINILIGFTGNVWLLTFLWSVNGLAQGCGWPPCTKLLREWFSPYEVGSYVGNVNQIFEKVMGKIFLRFRSLRLFLVLRSVASAENCMLVTTNRTEHVN